MFMSFYHYSASTTPDGEARFEVRYRGNYAVAFMGFNFMIFPVVVAVRDSSFQRWPPWPFLAVVGVLVFGNLFAGRPWISRRLLAVGSVGVEVDRSSPEECVAWANIQSVDISKAWHGGYLLSIGRKDGSALRSKAALSHDALGKLLPMIARHVPPKQWSEEARTALQTFGQ